MMRKTHITAEEKDFTMKEQYMNPITGKMGQKVSSEWVKRCWIKLKEMMNEAKTQYQKL